MTMTCSAGALLVGLLTVRRFRLTSHEVEIGAGGGKGLTIRGESKFTFKEKKYDEIA